MIDTFVCVGSVDPASKATSAPPASLAVRTTAADATDAKAAAGKGKGAAAPAAKGGKAAAGKVAKGKGAKAEEAAEAMEVDEKEGGEVAAGAAPVEGHPMSNVALATMDIFAGCGGLSEGFHQVGGVGGGAHP